MMMGGFGPDRFLGVTEPFWCSLAAALQRAEPPGALGLRTSAVPVVEGG